MPLASHYILNKLPMSTLFRWSCGKRPNAAAARIKRFKFYYFKLKRHNINNIFLLVRNLGNLDKNCSTFQLEAGLCRSYY